MDDEAKKMERVSSSLDHGRQDSAFASDPVGKKEAERESANGVYSTKKSNAPSGATAAGDLSSPAEGNEHNLLSTRHSSRTPIDDEKGVVGHHTHRTLPGTHLFCEDYLLLFSKKKKMFLLICKFFPHFLIESLFFCHRFAC